MSSRYYLGSTFEGDIIYIGSAFEGDIIYVGSTFEVDINNIYYDLSWK